MALFKTSSTVYILLFFFVITLWVIYYVTNTIKGKGEHFIDLTVEDETPKSDAPAECKLYNMRQEVINIFELYLSRKPSVEEIQKYSSKGNEQDILVAIISDFNVSTSESDKKRTALETMRVDHCLKQNSNHVREESIKLEEPFNEVVVQDSKDVSSKVQHKKVCIPIDDYQLLKEKLIDIEKKIEYVN